MSLATLTKMATIDGRDFLAWQREPGRHTASASSAKCSGTKFVANYHAGSDGTVQRSSNAYVITRQFVKYVTKRVLKKSGR